MLNHFYLVHRDWLSKKVKYSFSKHYLGWSAPWEKLRYIDLLLDRFDSTHIIPRVRSLKMGCFMPQLSRNLVSVKWPTRISIFFLNPKYPLGNPKFCLWNHQKWFWGPKIAPLSFSQKFLKNITPHVFAPSTLNFCPIFMCHTILESWSVEY